MQRNWALLLSFIAIIVFLFGAFAEDQPENGEANVIVLGIAQDGGIPHIGCRQQICRTQHHFVSSLLLRIKNSVYLIDATPDLREQYFELTKRFPDLSKQNLFDGIFLTHAHIGHYSGLLYLGKESISTKDVPVYCSHEMAAYLTKNAPWSLLVSNRNIQLRPFDSNDEVALDGVKIQAIRVPHRKEFTDTHGFLIRGARKTLLYIPDIDQWEPVATSISDWLTKADYALLDGTFYSGEELPGRDIKLVPHPTVQHSMVFFGSLPSFTCRIFFTHLNHTNPLLDPESAASKEFAASRYHVAAEWQEFKL